MKLRVKIDQFFCKFSFILRRKWDTFHNPELGRCAMKCWYGIRLSNIILKGNKNNSKLLEFGNQSLLKFIIFCNSKFQVVHWWLSTLENPYCNWVLQSGFSFCRTPIMFCKCSFRLFLLDKEDHISRIIQYLVFDAKMHSWDTPLKEKISIFP